MQIQYTSHNFDLTPAIKDHVEKKLARIKSHSEKITNIHVILEVDKLRQIAEVNVAIPGTTINAKAESEDMYKTVDLLVDKLNAQLTRYKEKHDEHH